jgi:glycosyltransferase involved in cell wall biosynthesis
LDFVADKLRVGQAYAPTRVILLSQYMFPESNATGDLMTSLAMGLAANGFVVTAYSAQPSYYGADRVRPRLSHQGITIRRLWSTRLGRRATAARAIDGGTFIARLLLHAPRFQKEAVIVAVTNPPFLPVVAAIRKVICGNRFVLIVHDVYPEIAVQLGALKGDRLAHRILSAVDRFVLSRADAVVVLGRDMRDRMRAKIAPSIRDRIVVIPNWADGHHISVMAKSDSSIARAEGLLDTFVVQYSGNLGLSQPFDVILEAARRLARSNVTFTFVGSGVQAGALTARVSGLGLGNVRFLGRVTTERLGDSLAACDVAVVPLARGIEGLSVPCKYYGILASGRPVIAAMSPDAEVARSVTENRCGVLVPPDDPSALTAAIRMLAADQALVARLGRNARATFERLYTRDRAIAAYGDVLREVLRVGRPLASTG